MNFKRRLLALSLFAAFYSPQLFAQTNQVNGSMFTLTNTTAAPNGVWSWFEDERAIVDWSDPNNPRLLVSSVSAGAAPENGDIDLLWRNLRTGVQGHFELANQLEQDDHNSASLYIRPDGRILAMYSRHGTDQLTRWRISTNPFDPTSFGAEQTLNNGAGTTYNNTYFLPGDRNGLGRTYNFTRTTNFDPNVQISNDNGTTWTNAGKLLTEGGGGDRPYVRYATNGKRIYMMTTERHPRNFNNSVYAGYVRDGVLYRMDGSVADSSLFDPSGVAPSSLSTVFQTGSQFNGNTLTRAWTINTEVDKAGMPVGIISARVNENDLDHRFLYARYDGLNWQVNEIARAGGYLYAAENDYTGLVSIDPDNPNVIYMSTPIDPRSNTATTNYEVYKGFTNDFGKSWSWTAITSNSTMDNIRPVVAQWNGRETALTWLRGTYSTYTNWSTEVVGINFTDTDPKALLWRGDASGATTTWDNASTANWDSGGRLTDRFNAGDEVTFDDSAVSTTVNVVANVTPMSVAFANESKNYQVTGPGGIGGNGGLRVIGGANVTLSNGNNTYTGDTMVARGTLALSGNAQLSGTKNIHVADAGTLNTTGLTSGAQVLNNQKMTVDGNVVGNLSATLGSTLQLNSTNSVAGNVNLSASTVEATGSMTGDLNATNGSIIKVGSQAMSATVVYQYVDATTGVGGNTSLANGSVFNPPAGTSGANASTWVTRSALANNGTVIQGGSNTPSELPTLRTIITGLTPGERYHAYVNYWDADAGSEWRILAGVNQSSLSLFDSPVDNVAGATNGISPSLLGYANSPLITEGNRSMWAGDLGYILADANGRFSVFIDDTGTAFPDDRTWYDGISFGSSTFTGQSAFVINGNLNMDNSSTLQLDIGSISYHDRLMVTGLASFAGTLELKLATGAESPVLGDSFDLLDFASSTGQFTNFILPTLSSALVWDSSQLYSQGVMKVSAIPEPGSLVVVTGAGLYVLRRYRKKRADQI